MNDLSVSFYLRPKIYLVLDYVGDVYFGVEPRLTFKFTKDVYDSDCGQCFFFNFLFFIFLIFFFLNLKIVSLNDTFDKQANVLFCF